MELGTWWVDSECDPWVGVGDEEKVEVEMGGNLNKNGEERENYDKVVEKNQ